LGQTSILVAFSDTGYWKASIMMEVQHLYTLKDDRRLDVTEHAAELSKDGPKAKTETK